MTVLKYNTSLWFFNNLEVYAFAVVAIAGATPTNVDISLDGGQLVERPGTRIPALVILTIHHLLC